MFLIILLINYLAYIGMASSATPKPVLATPKPPIPITDSKIPLAQKKILNDLPWALRFTILKESYSNGSKEGCGKAGCSSADGDKTRRVGVQALIRPIRREDAEPVNDPESDDTNMKMKLFRLMYETVRDSDLKVKRAELIKKSYANSSSFEVGYLLGDVTDKFNIMTDINLTLKRLYHEWKPIEHINAYEQVANLAIDVGHIVDLIKGFEKKLEKEAEQDRKKGIGQHPGDNDQSNTSQSGYFQIQ